MVSWTNGNKVMIESNWWDNHDIYVTISYNNRKQKVQLATVPSNLRKGDILYFICPITGKRCRILYNYNTLYWASREAFKGKLYYESQICDKNYYYDVRYRVISEKLDELYKRSKKKHYKGKITKLAERIRRLEKDKEYHKLKRDEYFVIRCTT